MKVAVAVPVKVVLVLTPLTPDNLRLLNWMVSVSVSVSLRLPEQLAAQLLPFGVTLKKLNGPIAEPPTPFRFSVNEE